jgi:hypothetical protein
VNLRRQDGQIVPLLMVVMLSLMAFGVLFFQVGRAAIFSTEAQTAADAAALGAVEEIKAQLTAQVAASGTSDLALLDPARIKAAAERYANQNKGHVIKLERRGVDVKVWTQTLETLGKDAKRIDQENARGAARARARIDVLAFAQPSGGQNIGSNGGGGIKRIKDREWKDLAGEISKPPTCGTSARSNDLVALGNLLKAHGFTVGENAEMGDNPAPGVHSSGGYHYRCRNSAALDVNHDQFNEAGVIDAIVEPLHDLGFRTIWRAAGHFDHIHIDVANSPAIGLGFGFGGSVGALEETTLVVKLIDWDAADLPFTGFGGAQGVFFGGPPDMKVAAVICQVLDQYHASPKVRLSAFETAIVESGVHNLTVVYDHDSLGVFQQRASWGSVAQRTDPRWAAQQYVSRAVAKNSAGMSAGQLAQSVQNSNFPDRYDQVQLQAYALMQSACGS